MVASIILKKLTKVQFVKIEINVKTGKMKMKVGKYNLNSDEITNFNKHRVILPCRIDNDIASFYVPVEWDGDSIENYTQALMDELYLNKNKTDGYKTIEQIEQSFVLEIILL